MSIPVSIKHAGKSYTVSLDPGGPPAAFKQIIYETTGVPPDRMKVMFKGGVLKDDTSWSAIGVKENFIFTIIGAAGPLPKAPEKPVVFLEDMDDASLASAIKMPVGLKNLGNTCYMNSTVQALRAIPELRTSLASFSGGQAASNQLTSALNSLYQNMAQTTEGFPPAVFLNRLRHMAPQFAEERPGQGFAQQDAEECLGTILSALRQSSLTVPTGEKNVPFEKFVMGEITKELKCDEAPDEPASYVVEPISEIECNITSTTNYMETGIRDNLDQKIEKSSPSLGREAVYSQKSRLSRIPSNLLIHMVRFYWRRDIGKKAKIMRKVKFPFELDVLDWTTAELKEKLLPVNRRLREIEQQRADRIKIRKRSKTQAVSSPNVSQNSTMPPTIMAGGTGTNDTDIIMSGDVLEPNNEIVKVGDQLSADEEELALRAKEVAELEALVHEDLKNDTGCNPSGLYDLIGIIGHKGASADSGHYLGYVRRDVFESQEPLKDNDYKNQWVKFDDDKVSYLQTEKILQLEGGGEDTAAYILLYRQKSLA